MYNVYNVVLFLSQCPRWAACMALLYRAARLKDRADTHVFTFVVTRSATREPDRDVTSKDFCCAHQRWAVAFSRTDAALGTYPTTNCRRCSTQVLIL